MKEVLELLDVSYKKHKSEILSSISLKINRGDIYVLLGNADAKAEQLLNLLNGTVVPFSGTIKLFENSMFQEEKCRVAYVSENPLLANLSIKENLTYFTTSLGIVSISEKISRLLKIDMNEKKAVKKLPYYTCYKLNLQIALLGNPDFVMLDNPFSGLDHIECDDLIKIISNLSSNITFLITSQNYYPASQIATRFGIIHKGKIITEFTPAELAEQCKRCIKVRTTNIEKAVTMLDKRSISFEVLEDDIIRVFASSDKSSMINRLFVENDIDISEIFIVGTDKEEYISKVMRGEIID